MLDLAVSADLLSASTARILKSYEFLPLLVGATSYACVIVSRHLRAGRQAGRLLRLIPDFAANGIALIDRDGMVSHTNPPFLQIFRQAHPVVGTITAAALCAPYLDHHERAPLLPDMGETAHLLRIRSDAGPEQLVEMRARKLAHEHGDGWLLAARDVTAERLIQTERAVQQRVFDTVTDGILVADLRQHDLPTIQVNKAFLEITGYSEVEVLGRNARYLQGHDRDQSDIRKLRESIARRMPAVVTLRNYRKDGTMFWNEMRLAPVRESDGGINYVVGTIRDVTAQRENTARLERLAFYEPATGLLNRTHFPTLLQQMLRQADQQVLLIKVEVLRFFEIAACFGNAAVDQLRADIGARLRAVAQDGIVGLLATNKVALAVPIASAGETAGVVGAVAAALAAAFELPAGRLQVFFAIGSATADSSGDAQVLMRHALIAILASHRTQIGAPRRFETVMEAELEQRARLYADLETAAANHDFVLYYQPQVELATGRVVGGEALLRWRHPVYGLQPPDRFVPIAEQTSQIIAMGGWALEEATHFAARINRDRVVPLIIAVNISPLQLQHDDLALRLRIALRASGAVADWLTLEITGVPRPDWTPDIVAQLAALNELGVGLALDDVGAGAFDPEELQTIRIGEVKISGKLVRDIDNQHFNRVRVESVVKLASARDVSVTAEGIETEANRRTLAELGVQSGQGYYFSMPLEADDFAWLVAEHTVLPVHADQTRGAHVA